MRLAQSERQTPLSVVGRDVSTHRKHALSPHQALVPSREQLKYRAGAPAMEMNATSFNLVGFWPC